METSLHRALKAWYAADEGGRVEVRVDGYRIDAVEPDGRLVEVQCGPLAALRPKLARLLPGHRVRVVQPVLARRRIVRRDRVDGPDRSARYSPRRGDAFDAFEHLVGLAGLLAEPNLTVDVLRVEVDEVRLTGRGRRGDRVLDRRLREVVGLDRIAGPADLLAIVPGPLPQPFTTRDLARLAGRPDWLARRAAYCLRVSGAAVEVGRRGALRSYRLEAPKVLICP